MKRAGRTNADAGGAVTMVQCWDKNRQNEAQPVSGADLATCVLAAGN